MAVRGVDGSEQLANVGRRLKAVGRGDLRRELLRGIRKEGAPSVEAVQQSAAAELPHSGGLAELIAGQKFAVRTNLSSRVGIKIVGDRTHDLASIDAGVVRHPVWGDRERWTAQSVAPGFFTRPLEARAPQYRKAIQRVLDDIAQKVTR